VPGNNNDIEKRLWGAADELRANSKLKASEYSLPVLGLIFLKYADFKFRQAERAHREYVPAQIEFIANIVRLYRGKEPETTNGSLMNEKFPEGK
jgi:type I restriction-modification system DNA methylase subunit